MFIMDRPIPDQPGPEQDQWLVEFFDGKHHDYARMRDFFQQRRAESVARRDQAKEEIEILDRVIASHENAKEGLIPLQTSTNLTRETILRVKTEWEQARSRAEVPEADG